MSVWYCSDCEIAYAPNPYCPRCGQSGIHQHMQGSLTVINKDNSEPTEENPEKRTPQEDFSPVTDEEMKRAFLVRPDDEMSEDEKNEVGYNIIICRYVGDKLDDSVEIDSYGVLREAWNDIEDMINKRGWNWDG
jgi:RNA polymerase subunit RPABC4/transcription elongation factor Spt4